MARSLRSAMAFDMTADSLSFEERQAKEKRRADGFVMVDYETELVGRDDNRPVEESAAQALALLIEKDGLGSPILAREIDGPEPPYELIAGQHRVRAYQILKGLHPGSHDYDRIECKLVSGMDDETAHSLMVATNLDVHGSKAERGRFLTEMFGEEARRIKEKEGGREREIIAKLYTSATGQQISPSVVQKALSASKDAEVTEELTEGWQEELSTSSVKGSDAAKIAKMEASEQDRLLADWSAQGRDRSWLAAEVKLRTGQGKALCRKAMRSLMADVDLMMRCQRAGYTVSEGEYRAFMNVIASMVNEEGTDEHR